MKRFNLLFSGLFLCAVLCYGTSLSRAQSASAIAHGSFPVKVVKTLDSSKLKEGDSFEVETAEASSWRTVPSFQKVPKSSVTLLHPKLVPKAIQTRS